MRVQSREPRSRRPKTNALGDPGYAREPVRTCVGCRGSDSRSALVRLVIAVSDHDDVPADFQQRVVVDERKLLPGRGAWLHPESRCWKLAERRRALHRALNGGRHLDVGAVSAWFDQYDNQHRKVLDE